MSMGLYGDDDRKKAKRDVSYGCKLRKYLFTMILLLSGDIALNPGPFSSEINNLEDFTRSRGIKLLHQNICGLISHKHNLEEFLSRPGCEKIHVMGISESHLVPNDSKKWPGNADKEIQIDGFITQRNDRKCGRGGGVVVYVRNSLKWIRRQDLECPDIECVWLGILLTNLKVYLLEISTAPRIRHHIFPMISRKSLSLCCKM